jgi:hypothetical protein
VRFRTPRGRSALCSARSRRSREQSRVGVRSIFGFPDPWHVGGWVARCQNAGAHVFDGHCECSFVALPSRRRRFFLPVRVLSCRFRKLYLRYLKQIHAAGKLRFHGQLQHLSDPAGLARAPLRRSKWVVYAKAPFGGLDRVLDYLGCYTHRVAISNNRLKN